MVPAFMQFQGWFMRRFPEAGLKGLLQEESTLGAAELDAEVRRVSRAPEAMARVLRLADTASPIEDKTAGFFNDLASFASPEPLPLGEVRCPMLIMHGKCDGDVPFTLAGNIAGGEILQA